MKLTPQRAAFPKRTRSQRLEFVTRNVLLGLFGGAMLGVFLYPTTLAYVFWGNPFTNLVNFFKFADNGTWFFCILLSALAGLSFALGVSFSDPSKETRLSDSMVILLVPAILAYAIAASLLHHYDKDIHKAYAGSVTERYFGFHFDSWHPYIALPIAIAFVVILGTGLARILWFISRR